MITMQEAQREDVLADHCASAPGSVADLLVRARDGDSVAWEEIVRRYSSVVFATVRSFRLQDADVLDAVQMTWLRLHENAHRVQYPERLAGWLATTARRECLHILRQQAKHAPAAAETVAENVVDPCAGPEQRVIDHDTARTLWNLVAELSPLRRSLLRALFTENPRSYTEVARSAGIPPGGIGPTRARALQQLRRRLDEYGLGPEI
ncbi:MAG: RNA polymerase sigma factor [Pseudonocardiaceae bacterium]